MTGDWTSRDRDIVRLRDALDRAPAVLVTGARRVGKTALIRAELAPDRSHYFDLEGPRDRARLADPMLALEALGGMIVIDEVQRMPELFLLLRVLIDGHRRAGRFLLLGSASPDLVGLSAESLAGRIAMVELGPLALAPRIEAVPAREFLLWTRPDV